MGELRIGTSGWIYRHWKGRFYPADLSPRRYLEYYAEHFCTVELNSPFYRLPSRKTFEGWRERTPEGFVFAVKANRTITHLKKLKDTEKEVESFFSAVRGLGEKLGPILFQLPPSLRKDRARLEGFLTKLPPGRYAFEFRHPSWFCDEIYELLREKGIALCVADSPRFPCVRLVTSSLLYVRLHGSTKLYASCYTEEELRDWASFIREHLTQGDAFIYFDNDYAAYAVQNAKELEEILSLDLLEV